MKLVPETESETFSYVTEIANIELKAGVSAFFVEHFYKEQVREAGSKLEWRMRMQL
ncbi:MAG: hypothetical protein WD077_09020 [Bacteroidia bacterium]